MGRRVAGGADEAVSPTEFDAIAKSGTGRSTQTVAPGSAGLSRGDVGAVHVNRHTRTPEEVFLSEDLTDAQLFRVYGHEWTRARRISMRCANWWIGGNG